ncbi:hypothetical protein [Paenibacillus tarimensis]|nr:hypothetical protein [Paenibacillus tarimensis]
MSDRMKYRLPAHYNSMRDRIPGRRLTPYPNTQPVKNLEMG